MNRADFMRNLAELLADVSPSEREEAIQYYNDYFDDAGAENEQSVIASLGTPEQLAKSIKAGLFDGGNAGEFTEKGFSGYEQKKNDEVLNLEHSENRNDEGNNWQSGDNGNNDQNSQNSAANKQEKKPMSGGTIAVIVILCVLASPFLLGIGGGALGVILGVLGSLIGVVVGFWVAAVSLFIVWVCVFLYGITLLFGAPLAGLCVIGAGMVCMAIGLVFLWIVVMICGMLIPAVIRGVVKLFQSIFHNRGGAAA